MPHVLRGLALGSLTCVAAAPFIAGQPVQVREPGPLPARITSADLAVLLAANRLSAGLVLRLSPDEERELQSRQASRETARSSSRSSFGVWREKRTFRPAVPLAGDRSAFELLAEFATREPKRYANTIDDMGGALLVEVGTSGCLAALSQRLPADIEADDYVPLTVARVVNSVTGAKSPGGIVNYGGSKHSLIFRAGWTLQQALQHVTTVGDGLVWVAVQTAQEDCSLGMLVFDPGRRSASTLVLSESIRHR